MTVEEQINFLTRGCVDVVSKADLAKKLESGKTLKAKLGCDPTSADLHLGHSVALSLLRRFQDLGHKAVLVIGDFTAAVGDPSGRDSTRPVLPREKILENAKTYTDQAFKVLDPAKTEIRFNSEWLEPFTTGKELLQTLQKVTVAQVLERDDFKKRMAAGNPISMLEVLYSLFQGQDSVALQADVELGADGVEAGADQQGAAHIQEKQLPVGLEVGQEDPQGGALLKLSGRHGTLLLLSIHIQKIIAHFFPGRNEISPDVSDIRGYF